MMYDVFTLFTFLQQDVKLKGGSQAQAQYQYNINKYVNQLLFTYMVALIFISLYYAYYIYVLCAYYVQRSAARPAAGPSVHDAART